MQPKLNWAAGEASQRSCCAAEGSLLAEAEQILQPASPVVQFKQCCKRSHPSQVCIQRGETSLRHVDPGASLSRGSQTSRIGLTFFGVIFLLGSIGHEIFFRDFPPKKIPDLKKIPVLGSRRVFFFNSFFFPCPVDPNLPILVWSESFVPLMGQASF